MARFNVLFSRQDDSTSSDAAGATLAKPPKYDPHLLLQLKQEHAALRKLYTQMQEAHDTRDFHAVRGHLREFKIALNIHLLEENVKFYAYLRHKISASASDIETMTSFWKEMQDIGKAVLEFVRKYDSEEFHPDALAAFGTDLEQIGPVLMNRLEREESDLFSLYLPAK